MNFLAHAYLSFEDAEVLTGNLISDFVKGKKKFDYSPRILGGINLHRAIDEFTDTHPVTKEAAMVFKPAYGLYSSAFIDVAYDHFLALQLLEKGKEEFKDFCTGVYKMLEEYENVFPEPFRRMFPYMKHHDWLYNYQYMHGIERSFEGLVHRARYLDSAVAAMEVFENNYHQLSSAYDSFFPLLADFSLRKFADIH